VLLMPDRAAEAEKEFDQCLKLSPQFKGVIDRMRAAARGSKP